ncbi:MAG TPA: hypothetical protein VH595_13280 [Verrucomicrobiae bacterium]|jgi:hypothetical protein|nr:hypothetical protein [Verrucomicrobiae bacterium]
MIAAFLRAPDGQFDIRQVVILLFCSGMDFFLVRYTYQGLKTGRILYGLERWSNRRLYAGRETSPAGFWFVVCYYCVGMAMFSTLAVAFCFFGLAGKMPD